MPQFSREYIEEDLGLDEGLLIMLQTYIKQGGQYRWLDQPDPQSNWVRDTKALINGNH